MLDVASLYAEAGQTEALDLLYDGRTGVIPLSFFSIRMTDTGRTIVPIVFLERESTI